MHTAAWALIQLTHSAASLAILGLTLSALGAWLPDHFTQVGERPRPDRPPQAKQTLDVLSQTRPA
jgi:hypothetical protein